MSENLNTNNTSNNENEPYSLRNFSSQEQNKPLQHKNVLLPAFVEKPKVEKIKTNKSDLPNRNNPTEQYIADGVNEAESYANYHGDAQRSKEIVDLETQSELPARQPEDRNTTSTVGKVNENLNANVLNIPFSELTGSQDELGSGSNFDALVQELGDPTKQVRHPNHWS